MGRFITTAPASSITLRAGNSISQNDLVSLYENGRVYKSPPSLYAASSGSGPLPAPLKPMSAPPASLSLTNPSVNRSANLALDDGNFMLVGTNAGTKVSVFTEDGTTIASQVTLDTASALAVQIIRLNTTQALVSWTITGAILKFAIVSSAGVVTVAATTVASILQPTDLYWGTAVLADGKFVVSYNKANTSKFSLFSALGVLQGAEVTYDSVDAINYSVLGCSDGTFILHYFNPANGAIALYSRTSTGTSLATSAVAGAAWSNPGNIAKNMVEMTGGQIVVVSRNATPATAVNITSYSSSLFGGISQFQLTDLDNGGFAPSLIATKDDQVVVFANSNTASIFSRMHVLRYAASTLKLVRSLVIPTAGTFTATTYFTQVFNYDDASFTLVRSSFDSVDKHELRLISVDIYGNKIGNELVAAPVQAATFNFSVAQKSNGVTIINIGVSYFGAFSTSRNTILGVASTSVTTGQDVVINTTGKFTINQTFADDGSFTSVGGIVPGNQGTVIDNVVYLLGM